MEDETMKTKECKHQFVAFSYCAMCGVSAVEAYKSMREKRDRWKNEAETATKAANDIVVSATSFKERMIAAEGHVEALEAALLNIESRCDQTDPVQMELFFIARRALTKTEKPKRNPNNRWEDGAFSITQTEENPDD